MAQATLSLPEKISGYDLANHILSQGGVNALIHYAGNAETDWLELKAGMCLLPEDKKKGDELDIVMHYLPRARAMIDTLRAGWTDTKIPVEGILPFNYC